MLHAKIKAMVGCGECELLLWVWLFSPFLSFASDSRGMAIANPKNIRAGGSIWPKSFILQVGKLRLTPRREDPSKSQKAKTMHSLQNNLQILP